MRRFCAWSVGLLILGPAWTAFSSEINPTFSREIAPLIYKNCTSCHRTVTASENADPATASGPFPLQTYHDLHKRLPLIEEVVSRGLMPPWKAADSGVRLKHERQLVSTDVNLIRRWIAAGAPEGDPKETPPLPDFPVGWQLGQPDLILKMPEAYTVPAEGPDIYRNFALPTGLTQDRWIRAIEFRPGKPSVVHHSLFFVETTGRGRELDAEDPKPGFRGGMGTMSKLRGKLAGPPALVAGQLRGRDGNEAAATQPTFSSLGGWALGAQPHSLPEGLAFHLPAGSDVILSTHFHPSGTEELEQSTIGFYFAPAPPQRRFMGIQLPPAFGAFKGIDLAPGDNTFAIEETFEFPIDVQAFGVSAHAHYLGKTFDLTATLPDGEKKTLLSIPDWDFAWQEQYEFAEFVSLPKGTKLHVRITYDNSADNPRNPTHPPRRVQFGEESTDEMGSMTLLVVASKEDEFADLQSAYREHFRTAFRQAPWLKLIQNRFSRR